jgi:CheY-like chemotaxis protein
MTAQLLVVDDDEFFLSLTKKILERSGYAVDSAADGLAAWTTLESDPHRFDLLLSSNERSGYVRQQTDGGLAPT